MYLDLFVKFDIDQVIKEDLMKNLHKLILP